MAICSNCGHYVHEGITQCDVCGTPIVQTPIGAPPPVQSQMAPPPVQPQMAPPPVQPQMAPPPVPSAVPQEPVVQAGVEVVQTPAASVQPQQPQPVSPQVIPSVPNVETVVKGEVKRAATQVAQQVASNAGLGSMPSIPSIPSIPSVPSVPDVGAVVGSVGSMASGGVMQAATQMVQQLAGGSIDLTMSNMPGLMVTQRWTQLMSPAGGAVGAVASQAKKWTRNKLSWLWFLIPIITTIIYLIK